MHLLILLSIKYKFSLKALNTFMRLKVVSHENNILVLVKKGVSRYLLRLT
jgi:hypothetical protein